MADSNRRITIMIPEKLYQKLLVRTNKESQKREIHKFSVSRTISDILEENL